MAAKVFHDPKGRDENAYRDWHETHQDNGFVLDRNYKDGQWNGLLHKAKCPDIFPDLMKQYTQDRLKVCAESEHEVEQIAIGLNQPVARCSHCF